MKIKLAGLQQHLSWQEQLASFESDALMEEDGWLDELFEALESGDGAGGAIASRRVPTPMPNFQRHNSEPKIAARTSFDEDFSRMQTHARSVLDNLGNAR